MQLGAEDDAASIRLGGEAAGFLFHRGQRHLRAGVQQHPVHGVRFLTGDPVDDECVRTDDGKGASDGRAGIMSVAGRLHELHRAVHVEAGDARRHLVLRVLVLEG